MNLFNKRDAPLERDRGRGLFRGYKKNATAGAIVSAELANRRTKTNSLMNRFDGLILSEF